MANDSKFQKDMIRRLDVISIFLLAQKGLSQKEIGKILGISHDKIQEVYGENYTKILPKKKSSDEK